VQLFYEKKIVYDGIPGYRYKIGNNFLNDLDDCFCTDKIKGTLKHDDGCLYSGALDLYDCLGKFNSKDFNACKSLSTFLRGFDCWNTTAFLCSR
jgi:hypothetical protein